MLSTYKYTFPILLCMLLATAEAVAAHGTRYEGEVQSEELSPEQSRKAELIMGEARPRLNELSQKMRNKMLELQSVEYANTTDPDVLPRLGRELQALRDDMRNELLRLNTRLQQEAGVELRVQRGRGCADLTRLPPAQPGEFSEKHSYIPASGMLSN